MRSKASDRARRDSSSAKRTQTPVPATPSDVAEAVAATGSEFQLGDLVICRYSTYPYWPATIDQTHQTRHMGHYRCLQRTRAGDIVLAYWCTFSNEDTGGWVRHDRIVPYHPSIVEEIRLDSSVDFSKEQRKAFKVMHDAYQRVPESSRLPAPKKLPPDFSADVFPDPEASDMLLSDDDADTGEADADADEPGPASRRNTLDDDEDDLGNHRRHHRNDDDDDDDDDPMNLGLSSDDEPPPKPRPTSRGGKRRSAETTTTRGRGRGRGGRGGRRGGPKRKPLPASPGRVKRARLSRREDDGGGGAASPGGLSAIRSKRSEGSASAPAVLVEDVRPPTGDDETATNATAVLRLELSAAQKTISELRAALSTRDARISTLEREALNPIRFTLPPPPDNLDPKLPSPSAYRSVQVDSDSFATVMSELLKSFDEFKAAVKDAEGARSRLVEEAEEMRTKYKASCEGVVENEQDAVNLETKIVSLLAKLVTFDVKVNDLRNHRAGNYVRAIGKTCKQMPAIHNLCNVIYETWKRLVLDYLDEPSPKPTAADSRSPADTNVNDLKKAAESNRTEDKNDVKGKREKNDEKDVKAKEKIEKIDSNVTNESDTKMKDVPSTGKVEDNKTPVKSTADHELDEVVKNSEASAVGENEVMKDDKTVDKENHAAAVSDRNDLNEKAGDQMKDESPLNKKDDQTKDSDSVGVGKGKVVDSDKANGGDERRPDVMEKDEEDSVTLGNKKSTTVKEKATEREESFVEEDKKELQQDLKVGADDDEDMAGDSDEDVHSDAKHEVTEIDGKAHEESDDGKNGDESDDGKKGELDNGKNVEESDNGKNSEESDDDKNDEDDIASGGSETKVKSIEKEKESLIDHRQREKDKDANTSSSEEEEDDDDEEDENEDRGRDDEDEGNPHSKGDLKLVIKSKEREVQKSESVGDKDDSDHRNSADDNDDDDDGDGDGDGDADADDDDDDNDGDDEDDGDDENSGNEDEIGTKKGKTPKVEIVKNTRLVRSGSVEDEAKNDVKVTKVEEHERREKQEVSDSSEEEDEEEEGDTSSNRKQNKLEGGSELMSDGDDKSEEDDVSEEGKHDEKDKNSKLLTEEVRETKTSSVHVERNNSGPKIERRNIADKTERRYATDRTERDGSAETFEWRAGNVKADRKSVPTCTERRSSSDSKPDRKVGDRADRKVKSGAPEKVERKRESVGKKQPLIVKTGGKDGMGRGMRTRDEGGARGRSRGRGKGKGKTRLKDEEEMTTRKGRSDGDALRGRRRSPGT